MKTRIIAKIIQNMQTNLDNDQLKKLQEVLKFSLFDVEIREAVDQNALEKNSVELSALFLSAKAVEGCSDKTIKYYKATICKMINTIEKEVLHITTDDLRKYLADYQKINDCSKLNVDNIRRILSTFFSWLEDEDYIIKSPVRRIKKIKTNTQVKEIYNDEVLEVMRDSCENIRDLALVDILSSTGMRVGELVKLNITDIDFDNRECIVLGKGGKERIVYFDARTKIHLLNYINSREDDNPALFVSLLKPYNRLEISGIEIRLRELGRTIDIPKIHPHKFRRTLATRAIDKGMPIEQVQKLLGHAQIDTTMRYAMVDQNNVKTSHRKFIG